MTTDPCLDTPWLLDRRGGGEGGGGGGGGKGGGGGGGEKGGGDIEWTAVTVCGAVHLLECDW